MDDAIQRLRQAHEADPANRDLEYKYLRALNRAGQTEELERTLALKFVCPLQWQELSPHNDSSSAEAQRHCQKCEKSVFYANTMESFTDLHSQGHCLSAPLSLVQNFVRQQRFELNKGPLKDKPCAVSSDYEWVDLETLSLEQNLLDFFEDNLAVTFQFLPLSHKGDELMVAVAYPLRSNTVEYLESLLDAKLVMKIADPEVLQRLINQHFDDVEEDIMGDFDEGAWDKSEPDLDDNLDDDFDEDIYNDVLAD